MQPEASARVPIAAVILDYGEVLSLPPEPSLMRQMASLTGLHAEEFARTYWRLRSDYDRGRYDGPAYWRAFAQAARRALSDEQIGRLIALDVGCWTEANPAMLRWVAELQRAGVKTAMLSNMVPEVLAYMRAHFDWMRDFTHLTFSCALGCIKPEAAVYRDCLAGLAVQPHEALFIDDREANVSAARALGLHALTFNGLDRLREQLGAYRLPLPAEASRDGDGKR